MQHRNEHWDEIFTESEDYTLGWYEQDQSQTLKLLMMLPKKDIDKIFLAGAGTSTLADELLAWKADLFLNDISQVALDRTQKRLGNVQSVHYICQDIATDLGEKLPLIDLWIDRAVLHFLTKEDEVQGYMTNLRRLLKVGGYVLFAEFSTIGVHQCAGLPVQQYDLNGFQNLLGDAFELVKFEDFTYINPKGDDRPYIYTLFKRVA
jgi:SAM-dependent methyltransferase